MPGVPAATGGAGAGGAAAGAGADDAGAVAADGHGGVNEPAAARGSGAGVVPVPRTPAVLARLRSRGW